MSAAMKKHFLAVLIDWREHLKEEMQKTFDHLKNKGESYADPIDRASHEMLDLSDLHMTHPYFLGDQMFFASLL